MLAGAIPASQALADRLIAAGYVGMRVQSHAAGASADDLNLVLWSWSADRPARVVLIDGPGNGDPTNPNQLWRIHYMIAWKYDYSDD